MTIFHDPRWPYLRRLALLVVLTLMAVPVIPAAPPVERASPRQTMRTFLQAMHETNSRPDIAARTLQARGLSADEREERARQLYEVMQARGFYTAPEQLPDATDVVDSATGRHIVIPFADEPQIVLVRSGDVWLFAKSTVDALPAMMQETYPFGLEALASVMPRDGARVLGLLVWQWIGIGVLLLAVGLLFRLLTMLSSAILRFVCKRIDVHHQHDALRRAARPLALVAITALVAVLLPLLRLPLGVTRWAVVVLDALLPLFLIIFLYRTVDVIAGRVVALAAKGRPASAQLLPLLRRSIKVVVGAVGLVIVLRQFNIDLTALVAGLSIGGAALALASQDTIRNLFGSFTIMTDRPFVVGDWIIVQGAEGAVEDIGLRSTRIRTFADSVITIPNGRLADMTIDNMGLRVYRRFRTTVGVTYETTPERLRSFVDGIRAIIEGHAAVLAEPDRIVVGFFDYDASALNILIQFYMSASTFREEVVVRQDINAAILALSTSLGVDFALPARSVRIEGAFPTATADGRAVPPSPSPEQ